jgi:hypothetical protein
MMAANLQERIKADRKAQGLPPTITDPTTLSKIAALVSMPINGDTPPGRKARRQRKEAKNGGAK